MLRHDWRFPDTGAALGPALAAFSSGWLQNGIGAPQPYPTFYYLGFLLWIFHALLTPLTAVMCIVTASVLILAASAAAVARQAGSGITGAAGVAAFAVLNPWVFSKLVAGHIFMVFAYAAMAALVAEIMRARPRTPMLVLLAALSVTQIEYFVLAFVPLTIWLVRTRRYAPLAVLWISALPIAMGILGSLSSLTGTPYNLEWQRAESVPLFSGLTLTGYQFQYAHAFEPWRWSIAICALVAALGLRFVRREALDKTVTLIALLCVIVATGTSGFIAPLYAYAVTHVMASGVFRELYDLLAILAIAYVLLAARQMATSRLSSIAFCAAAWSLALPWLLHPAFTRFVPGSVLPVAARTGDPQTRVAYLPAFQPLSYEGMGAGVDPDAYPIPGTSSPINEAMPLYPVDVALARAEHGDTGDLSALSVSSIVARPGYSSQWSSLAPQLSFKSLPAPSAAVPARLHALPLMALYHALPARTSIGDDLRENSLAAAMQSAIIFRPARETIDPRKAWVDARSAFIARPDWGNPWGGVATTSALPLRLPKGTRAILADVNGRLVDDGGRLITQDRQGMHWWATASAAVRCRGECLVVAAAHRMPKLPEHVAAGPFDAIRVVMLAPWLLYADLPANSRPSTLRYTVRYDRHWAAFDAGHSLAHVALDGIFNGWILPPSSSPRRLVIIESLAAVQLALEVLAALTALVLLTVSARDSDALQFFRNKHRIDLHDAGSGP